MIFFFFDDPRLPARGMDLVPGMYPDHGTFVEVVLDISRSECGNAPMQHRVEVPVPQPELKDIVAPRSRLQRSHATGRGRNR